MKLALFQQDYKEVVKEESRDTWRFLRELAVQKLIQEDYQEAQEIVQKIQKFIVTSGRV